jgi:phage terminase large subunit-like protein
MRIKYEEFIEEGSLIVMESRTLKMDDVYEDLEQFIVDKDLDVVCFGYDPYNAKTFVNRWETENGSHGLVKVPQGAKTESVPLGEIKTITEDRKLLFHQELMSYCMGNAIVITDTNGNKKLMKKKREHKIDNVAALIDAYIAYKEHADMF